MNNTKMGPCFKRKTRRSGRSTRSPSRPGALPAHNPEGSEVEVTFLVRGTQIR